MRYEIWTDSGSSQLIQTNDRFAFSGLGPCSEKVYDFEADGWEEAKEKMIGILYGDSDVVLPIPFFPEDPSHVPQSWDALSEYLTEHIKTDCENALLSEIPEYYLDHPMKVMGWITTLENRGDDRIKGHIRTLGKSDEWPVNPDEKVEQLISVRLRIACDFINSIHTPSLCIIPYPKLKLSSIIEWLLINWWDDVGVYNFSDKVCIRRKVV